MLPQRTDQLTRTPRGRTLSVTVLSLGRDSSRQKLHCHGPRKALFISASGLCFARTKSAFEINNMQRGRLTCYTEEVRLSGNLGGKDKGSIGTLIR
jgi:hypothetical protein